ncbi:hypothetical protein [Vibrio parahaemolyticus]|uniref:hypothetical protein n=1 Tax=Vibrio parahaemolyticus TaxID=670 RepID=UPI00041C4CC7|nr:hypothetical protein [Vibrio parahaemolyticus]HDY8002503.1 hypothetical protein [Vibrio vulnificus]
MDWIELLGAVGVGALVTKLIDVLWLQKILRDNEKEKWLRDKKLEAFEVMTKEILSLGKASDIHLDPFKGYALSARTILLVDSDELIDEIDEFVNGTYNLKKEYDKYQAGESDKEYSELEGAYDKLAKDSRELVRKLRKSLLES